MGECRVICQLSVMLNNRSDSIPAGEHRPVRTRDTAALATRSCSPSLRRVRRKWERATTRTSRTTTAADAALTQFRKEIARLPAARREIALKQWEILRAAGRGSCPTANRCAKLTARLDAVAAAGGGPKRGVRGRLPRHRNTREGASRSAVGPDGLIVADPVEQRRVDRAPPSHVADTVVVAQEVSGEFVRAGKNRASGSRSCSLRARRRAAPSAIVAVSGAIVDHHGRDCVARLAVSTGAGEGDKRLGECTCRSKQPSAPWSARSTSSTARWWCAAHCPAVRSETLASRISAPTRQAGGRARPVRKFPLRCQRGGGPVNLGRR